MGMGSRTLTLGAALLFAACSPEPTASAQNQIANQVAPAPTPAASPVDSSLATWVVGSWSFEESCATDFVVHYNADGTLQNGEDAGSWQLAGTTLTETIVERFEMGAEAAEKIDPPEKRSYTVERSGPDAGVIAYRGKKIPIRRC